MEKKDFFAPLSKGLGATRRAACVLLLMLLTMTAQTAWTQSTETLGGYTFTIGTDGDGQYYIVDCEAALRALSSYSTSNNCSGKRFVQTADITLTGTFAPIGGNSSSNTKCFKGTYDGGGHTISGLQVQVTTSNFSSASAGLFSAVKENGLVRNVGLIAPSVSCSCSGKECGAGAIAGYVEYGTITNCFVLNPGTITSNGSENYTGLFIGQKNGGTYANLYYYGTTALPMCGKNDLGNNHIERIYKVTAGSNAGLPTPAATEGFITQGSHYYREGATVQLSYTGSNPNGYRPVYSVSPTNTGASVTEQGVLTMGNGDITITATLSNIPLINISTGTIADIADQAYTGSAIVPDITLTVGGKVLTAGSDYLVSCTNNVNVGTATLTATGQGNYTGTLTKNFRIYYADKTSSCGTNVTYTLHDEDQNGHYEQLIISGTGAMTDFASPDDVPWAAYCKDITSVIVQSGVTHIGACAFYLCWYLTSVSLSEGLTSIGNQAFKGCIRLSALTVPASVESVGLNSFESLATSVSGGTLTFASGSRLTSVGNDAFYYAHASVDMSACTRLTAMPKAFQGFDKDVTFPHSLTSIAANCFSRNSSKDAKVYVHVPDNYVFTVNGETISATNGKADITSAIGVGTEHAAVTLSCTPDPAHFSVNGDGSYTIHTATGWNVFCDCLDDNDTYNRFSGKTVKLGNDIGTAQDPITRMAGSSKHDFCGTFDGDGHTLTVNISSDSRDYTAPFSYVSNTKANPSDEADSPAAIRNLHVTGTITTDKQFTGGLIGGCWGTVSIENCAVSTAITSTISGDGTHGGIVGIQQSGTLTITGCLFDGSLLGATTYAVGGFLGYRKSGAEIRNSLFAPAEVTVLNTSGATFARNKVDTYNSYYTYYLCDGTNYKPYLDDGTVSPAKWNNGKAAHRITAGENVTVANAGNATEYNVSGITAYGTGIKYGSNLYAGSGDQVSLTLTNTATGAPEGYQYGYFASAGTLDGTTLTMPDEDVTITVGLSVIDWATEGNSGDDADHPYMIYNKDQLLLLAHRVNGTSGETANDYENKYFKLGADIAFTHDAEEGDDYAENYEAIGGYIGGTIRYFLGDFNGDNHTVSGIRINKTGTDYTDAYQALFGCIGSGAEIHDVHVTDARITGYDSVGGIVGYTYGDIIRCSVTDSYITATGNWNYGTICGRATDTENLRNNYYHGCTVNGTAATSGKGCSGSDITANNGALPAYAITFGDGVSTTALASAPENGFVYNGVSYYRKGLALPLASILGSEVPEGYTLSFSANGTALSSNTYTVNATDADVTITVGLSVIDWATESDGDADHPYMIYNKDQLDLLAHRVNGTHDETRQKDGYSGKYFKLANDINYPHSSDWNDFTSHENNFEAIGGNFDSYNSHFRGHFDGNNKTISGIRIYKDGNGYADNYQGIFGRTANGADIHDLTLADARITGHDDIGGIVGYNSNISIVNRCHVAANVAICAVWSQVSSHGGIVGVNDRGTIENCISAATLTVADNSNYYGGIVGTNRQYSTLHDNLAIGATVPAVTANNYGAITGYNNKSTLQHNYYTACKVADVENATGVGCCLFELGNKFTIADVTENDGAVPALRDGADNTYALSLFAAIPATLDLGWGAGKYSVQLTGRTLYKDGDWNTLCLPFAMTAEQVAASALAGATLMELDTDAGSYGHVTGLDNGTLYLNFKDATSIEAGKPYLIKWAKANDYVDDNAHNIVNPVFSGVTIDNTDRSVTSSDGYVTFKGTYDRKVWNEESQSILFVGAGNTLYYPKSGAFVNACRAYFDLGTYEAREFVMNFEEGNSETTSLPQPLQKEGSQADAWYTLDGRKLNGKPTTKGLYIHNGKKVIIK